VLLQAVAFSYAAAQAQHVLDTDSAKEQKGDSFRAEVAASQNGGHVVQPGT